MNSAATVTLSRAEYDALVQRCGDLEDRLAAVEADNGVRIPHAVALAIIGGKSPMRAFRDYCGFTLRELAEKTGVGVSYLSEIERGHKTGSASALSRIAESLDATIDVLVNT